MSTHAGTRCPDRISSCWDINIRIVLRAGHTSRGLPYMAGLHTASQLEIKNWESHYELRAPQLRCLFIRIVIRFILLL